MAVNCWWLVDGLMKYIYQPSSSQLAIRPPDGVQTRRNVELWVLTRAESIFEVSRPPRPHLVAKKCEKIFPTPKKGPKWAQKCPILLEELLEMA